MRAPSRAPRCKDLRRKPCPTDFAAAARWRSPFASRRSHRVSRCRPGGRRLDRHLVGQPAARLGRGLLRPRRHPALAVEPDDPPGGAREPRRRAGPRRVLQRVRRQGDGDRAAHVAIAGADGAIDPATDRALTFGGSPSATVPPGAPIWSDPVDLEVPDLGSLAVSLYLPEVTPTTTWHNDGRQTAWIGAGDQTAAETIAADLTTNSRIFLSGIMVDAEPGDRGRGALRRLDHRRRRLDAEREQPLARRAGRADRRGGRHVSVLNEGISGARVLRDRMGENALARFERDVLGHPQADTVVVMMGINDIGWPWPDSPLVPEGEAGAERRGHHRRLRAADRAGARPRLQDHRRDADAVRGYLRGRAARGLLQPREGDEARGGQRVDPQRRRVRRGDRLRQGRRRRGQPEAHPGAVRSGRPSAPERCGI